MAPSSRFPHGRSNLAVPSRSELWRISVHLHGNSPPPTPIHYPRHMARYKPRALDDRRAQVTYRDPMFHGTDLNRAAREQVNRRSERAYWWIYLLIALSFLLQIPSWLNRSLSYALWSLG